MRLPDMLTLHSTLCAVNSSTPGAGYVAKCGRHEMQLKYRMVAVTSVTSQRFFILT